MLLGDDVSNNIYDDRVNAVLHYIHSDISVAFTGKMLADKAMYSEQHFHRIFKKVTKEPLAQYIRRVRMEHAANQLSLDLHTPIVEIAEKCGFNSLSSFNKSFKKHYGVAPGVWRNEQKYQSTVELEQASEKEVKLGYQQASSIALPPPEIVELTELQVGYIRHTGYNRSIKATWNTLKAWAISEGVSYDEQYGLYHSDAARVSLEQGKYVACIGIKEKPHLRNSPLSTMQIPGGLHARFELTGQYGELLPTIDKIKHEWIKSSGFKLKTTPIFVKYKKNQFLSKDEKYELSLFVPISLK